MSNDVYKINQITGKMDIGVSDTPVFRELTVGSGAWVFSASGNILYLLCSGVIQAQWDSTL